MPRSLPWARGATTDTATKRKAPAPAPRRPRRPSPSEATAVEYMIPSDEPYIMVEDELFTTAQLYTRSIHRAEYERLQAEATRKHAGRISAIHGVGPIDGVTRMSREVVMKRRGMTMAKAAAAAAAAAADSSEEEEEKGWVEGGNLARLMMGKSSSAEGAKLVVNWKRAKVATRAAAGFTESQVVDRRRGVVKVEREESRYKPEEKKPVVLKKEATSETDDDDRDDDGDDDDDDADDDDLGAPVIRDISRHPIDPRSRTAATSAASTTAKPHLPAPPRHPPVDARPNPPHPTSSVSPVPTTTHIESSSSSLPAPTETPFYPSPDAFSIPKPTSTYRGRSMAARRNAEREKTNQANHEHKTLDVLKSP